MDRLRSIKIGEILCLLSDIIPLDIICPHHSLLSSLTDGSSKDVNSADESRMCSGATAGDMLSIFVCQSGNRLRGITSTKMPQTQAQPLRVSAMATIKESDKPIPRRSGKCSPQLGRLRNHHSLHRHHGIP